VIPVRPVPEPANFDQAARKPGQAWLASHPDAERPHDYWSPFRADLATGFADRCGYSAMYEPSGTVDHYVSYRSDPAQAYEWSNYRYAAQWLNSSKKKQEVLDPYLVGPDWFEIQLPSLQLIATDRIPLPFRPIVERMKQSFPIFHDERIIRQRRQWYRMYQDGKLTLDGLREAAPLIAAAVEKQQARS
jgi:hypothetical protein